MDRPRFLVLCGLVTLALVVAMALDVHHLRTRPRVVPMGRDCSAPRDASPAIRAFICTGRLPVNIATASDLESLPGVGAGRARAIADHRASAGPFRCMADLEDVRGIGPVTAARLAPFVSFESGRTGSAWSGP
jgi:competence protein ComEA